MLLFTFCELEDLLVLLLCLRLLHQIYLVLKDDDVLELHNLHGSEMLRGLRLRARLVA